MANRHFGKIGDIWKHLPLAEILAIEKPNEYWESHAGSACYELTDSMEHAYGAFHFFNNAHKSDILKQSGYNSLLRKMIEPEKSKRNYPGSPFIAMMEMGSETRLVFHDLDSASLRDIENQAKNLDLNPCCIRCRCEDGNAGIASLASEVEEQIKRDRRKDCFAFLDPYDPFVGEISSSDVFFMLIDAGFQSMLWYGFDGHENRKRCHEKFGNYLHDHGQLDLWCGEIVLSSIHNTEFTWNPGVMGCGILLGNCSDRALATCENLGRELVRIYRDATFPDGKSGALEFTLFPDLR